VRDRSLEILTRGGTPDDVIRIEGLDRRVDVPVIGEQYDRAGGMPLDLQGLEGSRAFDSVRSRIDEGEREFSGGQGGGRFGAGAGGSGVVAALAEEVRQAGLRHPVGANEQDVRIGHGSCAGAQNLQMQFCD
jgi:hypothetical protein